MHALVLLVRFNRLGSGVRSQGETAADSSNKEETSETNDPIDRTSSNLRVMRAVRMCNAITQLM